jgi:hypothetical protein
MSEVVTEKGLEGCVEQVVGRRDEHRLSQAELLDREKEIAYRPETFFALPHAVVQNVESSTGESLPDRTRPGLKRLEESSVTHEYEIAYSGRSNELFDEVFHDGPAGHVE